MLVTWPFVMLLLDYWPLQRFQLFSFRLTVSALRPLVREKIPFLVLSGISCVLTYLTEGGRQEAAGFVESPALLRLENAFVAYARYLGKTFWPVQTGRALCESGSLVVAGGGGIGSGSGGRVSGRPVVGAAVALPAGGLVLVFGDFDARDRLDPGLGDIHGGSLHLPAAVGLVSHGGVGCGGWGGGLAGSARRAGQRGGRDRDQLAGGGPGADPVLAGQCFPVDAHAGLHL